MTGTGVGVGSPDDSLMAALLGYVSSELGTAVAVTPGYPSCACVSKTTTGWAATSTGSISLAYSSWAKTSVAPVSVEPSASSLVVVLAEDGVLLELLFSVLEFWVGTAVWLL